MYRAETLERTLLEYHVCASRTLPLLLVLQMQCLVFVCVCVCVCVCVRGVDWQRVMGTMNSNTGRSRS